MYRTLLLLATGLLLSAVALAASSQYTLAVKGVACPYCAFGIEKRLNKVDGVDTVVVDIGDSVVRVTMAAGARLTESQARAAVEAAGFTLHAFSAADTETDRDAIDGQ